MPCDSIAIAIVQVSEQASWLLQQLSTRPELKQPILAAIIAELQAALPAEEGWTVEAQNYAPVLNMMAIKFNASAAVKLAGNKPTFNYSRYDSAQFADRVSSSVGAALEKVAAQLIAELTVAEMAEAGFEILNDIVRDDGVRVLDWQYAVAT